MFTTKEGPNGEIPKGTSFFIYFLSFLISFRDKLSWNVFQLVTICNQLSYIWRHFTL